MIRRYGGTDFVTGLRAYAALAVVMVHTGAFSGFGGIGRTISQAGKHGVVIFFVIAGFSVATSYWQIGVYQPYLLRRLIRIWPVYMAAVAGAFLIWRSGLLGSPVIATQNGGALDAYSLFMHASLLSFLDYRVANNIIGVEWTIPIEVFWYIVIPLVMSRARHWRDLVGFAFAFLLLNAALRGLLMLAEFKHVNKIAAWMPFAFAPYFLAGVLAFQLRTTPTLWPAIDRGLAGRFVPPAAVLAIVIVAVLPFGDGLKAALFGVATFALIAFHRPGQGHVAWVLENRLALLLGTISYSLYLVHLPVVGLLQVWQPSLTGLPLFGAAVGVSSLLASVAYWLIERPANTFGRRLTTVPNLNISHAVG